MRWLKEVDRNTKYFHSIGSLRKSRNTNSSIIVDGTNFVDLACIRKETSRTSSKKKFQICLTSRT